MLFFKKVLRAGLSGVLFLAAGCVSVSNFQTGKPLGKGNTQGYAAVSHITTKSKSIKIDDSISISIPIEPEFTFFEIGAMLGINDRLDVGLKYTFPTGGSFDGKFCLLGAGKEKGFFLSPGLRAGYTSVSNPDDSDDSDDSNKSTWFDMSVPIYLTMNFTESFSLSLIPTYSGRFIIQDSYYSNLLGGNVNVKLGNRFGIIVDVAFYRNFKWEWNEIQGGGALFFPLPSLF